jgi:hypothetical protein
MFWNWLCGERWLCEGPSVPMSLKPMPLWELPSMPHIRHSTQHFQWFAQRWSLCFKKDVEEKPKLLVFMDCQIWFGYNLNLHWVITLHNDPMITDRYNDNHMASCHFELFPSCFFPFLDSSPSEYLQLGVSSGLRLVFGSKKKHPFDVSPWVHSEHTDFSRGHESHWVVSEFGCNVLYPNNTTFSWSGKIS